MGKEGLTVPKWVLINWPKIPQMPQKVWAQNCLPKPKSLGFSKKVSDSYLCTLMIGYNVLKYFIPFFK